MLLRVFAKLDNMRSECIKNYIQRNAGKSADELFRNAMIMTMRLRIICD